MSQCILGKTEINIGESAEVSCCCCRIITLGSGKVKKVTYDPDLPSRMVILRIRNHITCFTSDFAWKTNKQPVFHLLKVPVKT